MASKKINKNAIRLGVALAVSSVVLSAESCNSDSVVKDNDGNINNGKKDSSNLEDRLKKLSEIKFTGKLQVGAMCYKPAPPRKTDYKCSLCGNTSTDRFNSYQISSISQIENTVKQIKDLGYDVILDKSEFCEHCSKKKIENPELIFKIRFSKDAKYHIAKSNITNEYECLLQFLLEKETFKGKRGQEYAIHNNITIIQKMTGLGKDLKIENHGK